jgi:stage II sporulation protein GA (sporulation sigma-E factor processing peptidase)
MTVVYIDLLFLLNMTANYLLLLGAGRLSGAVLRRWRIALGSAFGALYAALLFLPGLKWMDSWLCKILSGILMPLISYGRERALFRVTAFFFAASAGLAGVVLALELLGGTALTIENGVLYSDYDLRLLLLIFAVCYAAMSLFFRRVGSHSRGEMIDLCIWIYGKKVELTALLDTGHTLTDPATNLPVVVVHGSCVVPLLPITVDPAQPVESLKRCKMAGISGVRLIPYRAVGLDCGMLFALKSSEVIAGGKTLSGALIALSPTPVDDGGGYQALIGVI